MLPPGLQALVIVTCVFVLGVAVIILIRTMDCTSVLGTTVCR